MARWDFEAIHENAKLPWCIDEVTADDFDAALTAATSAISSRTGYIVGDKIVIRRVKEEEIVLGASADAAATAGSTGTISAKLRYITASIGTILTNLSSLIAKLPAALTGGGNFKVSLEETKTGTSSITIQGTAADGASVSGNPLQIGGKDGTGNAQTLAAATSGALLVESKSPSMATPANTSTTADQQAVVATAGLRFNGWSVKENASGTARVIIRHGTTDTDTILAVIDLLADGSDFKYFEPGFDASSGIYVERDSGDVSVTIFNKTVV